MFTLTDHLLIRKIIRMYRKIFSYFFGIIVIILSLAACSTVPYDSTTRDINATADENIATQDQPPTDHGTKSGIFSRIGSVFSLAKNDFWEELRSNFRLPINYDSREVQQNILWFQKHQAYIDKTFARAQPYIYFIFKEAVDRNLPAEVTLLPVIESSYNPFLYSPAGATGLWQMMPGTASGSGLKINWWYDGRRDVVASTEAALNHIVHLYDFFDHDWMLAIAAYDSGEGKVKAAVKNNSAQGLPGDFWHLKLPRETKSYLPRLMALAAIIKDPDKYNISLPPLTNKPYFASINVKSQIDIIQAAKYADESVATIRLLNPGFRRWASDPDGPHSILLPVAKAKVFKERLAAAAQNERVTWQKHRVGRKETLQSISRKYNIDVGLLRKINDLSTNLVHYKQELLIPKTLLKEELTEDSIDQAQKKIAAEKLPGPQQYVHKVKRGDTIKSVAQIYGVKSDEVSYWNQVYSDKALLADDELVIWQYEKKLPQQTHPRPVLVYRVKSGDTISKISRKYKVKVATLVRLNKLHNNHIKPGQKLRIPGKYPAQHVALSNHSHKRKPRPKKPQCYLSGKQHQHLAKHGRKAE